MAINDYESSEQRGAPIQLFTFVYGAGLVYRYTDHEADVTIGADTWAAQPFEASAIKTKGDLSTGKVEIVCSKTLPVAELFRVYPVVQPVFCTIQQGHVPNGDDPVPFLTGTNFVTSWSGRIVDTERRRNTITLHGESGAISVGRPGLRRHYQRPCPLVVYGTRCGANKAAASAAAVVSGISGNQITLVAAWMPVGRTFSDFEAGLIEWTGTLGVEARTILRMDNDNVLYVDGPVRDLIVTQAVTMILKCGRTVDDCRTLHSNIVNYGGQPYIPTANPVGKNNHT